MAEYIEREQVKDELLSWAVCIKHPEHLLKEDALCVIDAIPAADVVTVEHGRWYDIVEFNNGERIIATCSNCKDRGELRTDRNEWGIWHINSPRCPNCGAKMKGD